MLVWLSKKYIKLESLVKFIKHIDNSLYPAALKNDNTYY